MISIAMPMKEPGSFYTQAIQSVLDNFPAADIVVVGPASAERYPAVQSDIRLGRIRFYEEPKKNLYSAVNFALSKARFEYVAWLNVDDEMAKLSDVALRTISQGSFDIYAFNVEFINRTGETTIKLDCYSSGQFGTKLADTWYCYVNSMIFRRELLQAVPFNENYSICSDRKFIFDLARLGPKVLKHNEPLIRYRKHDASLTFNSNSRFNRRTNSRMINRELRQICRSEVMNPSSLRSFLVACARYTRNVFEPFLFFMVKR